LRDLRESPIMPFPCREFMRLAIGLARKGAGRTAPNPAVGAVVVRDGTVVGSGFHRAAGFPHAEVLALRDAGDLARGADLYVTLEPCAHTGRTAPCTEAILAAGIRRVAAAMEDPNPLVSGKGIALLRDAGLIVAVGILRKEAVDLNRSYCRWIASGIPFVTLKLAVSLDGQIAGATGDSRWISGERSRRAVHRMRAAADAVLVGGGTLRTDDPLLTCRIRGGRDPLRVILTSDLSGLAGRRIFREGTGRIVLVCPEGIPEADVDRARSLGAQVLLLPARDGRIGTEPFLRALGREGVMSLLVEGGARTAGWLVSEDAVDRFVFFIAPTLLGEGIRAIAGWSVPHAAAGKRLSVVTVRRSGEDVIVRAEPVRTGPPRPEDAGIRTR
jgi:diaminohydroxyphosphoribosylaminopyrimidine deaminase / 5-amino-6-(5-phosphoribosylamino)uracil reductase